MSKKKRPKKKPKIKLGSEYDVYSEFDFIAGYTEGGFPYGITYGELEKEEEDEYERSKKRQRDETGIDIDDEDLPF
ncbi:MAG TPA: hypothetical protein VLQ66_07445 [Paenisporosarcina sp.]|nr:hypothetical protein [Paenisporosarcina sp.]